MNHHGPSFHKLLLQPFVNLALCLFHDYKHGLIATALFFVTTLPANAVNSGKPRLYEPDNALIQYTGRIDFSNPKLPRFWQPGVYFSFRFSGSQCEVIIHDEMLWGTNHNYLELVVDNKAYRIQTKSYKDTISLAAYVQGNGMHDVIIVKNTEANIGYLALAGIICHELVEPPARPERKIEFIGNSITCGARSDMSEMPCSSGKWHDQHNAWLSYGTVAARTLGAQYHLSSVSGIGLMKSCCNMNVIMPQVYDKVSMRNDTILWDFSKYQPHVVTVCLGQNDGIQDSATFSNHYLAFISKLRGYYPNATFLLLSSPMADAPLRAFMRKCLLPVVAGLKAGGDNNVFAHIFEKQYSSGCDYHPSVAEHAIIAGEVSSHISAIMGWK